MEQVKQKSNLRILFSSLFGNNISGFDNYNNIEIKDKELKEVMLKVDKMGIETEKPCHTESKASNNGGFSAGKKIEAKINPKTLNKMRENLKETSIERDERD